MTHPDTLRLVPVEPTPEMLEAAKDDRLSQPAGTPPGSAMRRMYKAMLSAAPASPLPDEAHYAPGVTPDMQVLWDRLKENDRRCAAPASPLPTESREVLSSTGLGDNGASPLGEGGGWWQDITCDEQFALATEIAANIGYVLQPEPDHPDCPHTRQGMTKILRDQLNDKSRRLRPLPAAPTGDAG